MPSRFTVPLPTIAPRICVVCEHAFDPLAALTRREGPAASSGALYPLCADPACRAVFEKVGDMPDAEFNRQLVLDAQLWREGNADMRRPIEERAEFLAALNEAEARQEAAAFAAIGLRPDLGPLPQLQLVAPSGRRPTRRLSQRRRRAHAVHLDQVIAAAIAVEALEAPAYPPEPDQEAGAADSDMAGRLCGVCGGGCCVSGKDHAYLNEATIRRVMASDPGLDPARVRAIYLDHLPQRAVADSCIHHTPRGCNLPRFLRSHTCDSYACEALKRLQIGIEAEPPARSAMVLRRRLDRWARGNPWAPEENAIVAAAVITETATTRFDPPPMEVWAADAPKDEGPSS